jgi:MFS family permease
MVDPDDIALVASVVSGSSGICCALIVAPDMYAIDWSAILMRGRKADPGGSSLPLSRRISGTVWGLGVTSLLTDISSEMVASVLPMYLVLQLGLSPLAFGFVDGLYQGMAALVRIIGGVAGDRWRRYKEVAAAGYGLSALCRLLLPAVGATWFGIASIVAVDRIGKGLRTAPRDALIALRTEPRDLGLAFGVHRSLDAAGAFLGPILAFLILARMDRAFDVLFVASFFVALLGVAAILLFVEGVRAGDADTRASATAAPTLLGDAFGPGRFRALVVAAALLGVPTISDSFIFLAMQARLQIGASAFPLLFVGTSLSTAICAVPAGRLADRVGRVPVFIGGYCLLVVCYVAIQTLSGVAGLLVPLMLLGAYYAGTDGVLAAQASAILPQGRAGSGLAALATVSNVSRLVASSVFGALWVRLGIHGAIWTYCGAMVAVLPLATIVIVRGSRRMVADMAS